VFSLNILVGHSWVGLNLERNAMPRSKPEPEVKLDRRTMIRIRKAVKDKLAGHVLKQYAFTEGGRGWITYGAGGLLFITIRECSPDKLHVTARAVTKEYERQLKGAQTCEP